MRKPILYLSDSRGVYIPRDFATETRRDCISGASPADLAILADGPANEGYWEAWAAVCDNATVTDPDTGVAYTLHQDGDLWLLPPGWGVDDTGDFCAPTDSEGC